MSFAAVPPVVVERHEITRFFATLYKDLSGVLELRTFGPEGDSETAKKLRREANRLRDFVPVKNGVVDESRVLRFLEGCEKAKLGAFFGVALRSQAALKDRKGGAAFCQVLPTFFLDADFKHLGEEETVRRINSTPLAPSMVVESGGGLHPYWILEPSSVFYLKRELPAAKLWLRHLASSVADVVDESVSEPARVLRIPGSYNFKYDPPRLVTLSVHTDQVYALTDIQKAWGEPKTPEASKSESSTFTVPETIPQGDRHTLLYRFLRSQKARDVPLDVALVGCHALNEKKCEPPIAHAELDDYLRRVWEQANTPDFDSNTKSEKTYPYTEAGDAEFFAWKHRDDVRFDHARKRWLHFDGNRWRPDEQGSILRLALQTMRDRQRIAVRLQGDDDGVRQRHLKWCIGGEFKNRLRNMLDIAQSLEPLADDGKNWDTQPYLLCAKNGVVDLRTGILRDGKPEDRITNCTHVTYYPDTTSDLWEKTLIAIFEGNKELLSYWQRLVGYSASGTAQEEMFTMLWGEGRNGKGTLIESIRRALGDYADDLPFTSLEKNARAAIANDMAKLPGKRFVTASETEGSVRLNEQRIKGLSGRDPQTCRFLHREFFTYDPMFVLFLATNEKPEIRDYSDGFWERVQLVPFAHQFLDADCDPTVKSRLKEDAAHQEAILAWIISGCRLWQQQGLRPPAEVLQATGDYRKDSQPLTSSLEDCCVLGPDKSSPFMALWDAYQRWAGRRAALNRQGFINELTKKFKKDVGRKVMYHGLCLGQGSPSDDVQPDWVDEAWNRDEVPPPLGVARDGGEM